MFPTLRRFQATPAYAELLRSIKVDLKQAMLAKKNLEKNTIRSILAAIKNTEIDGAAQTEFALSKTLNKMIKQRTVSAGEYQKQNRADLAVVETQEADIIRKYVESLPVASSDAVNAKVVEFMKELHAKDPSLKMRNVFDSLSEDMVKSWGADPSAVRAAVSKVYKTIFTETQSKSNKKN